MSLGERIQDARKRMNITQEELAEQLNVTRQSISRWESNIVYPDMDNLVRLSTYLEVSLDYLLKNEKHSDVKQVSRLLESLIGKEVSLELNTSKDYEFFSSKRKVIVVEVSRDWIKLESISKKEKNSLIQLIPVESIQSIHIKGEV